MIRLQTGQQCTWGSIPDKGGDFLLSTTSRPSIEPIHPPVQSLSGEMRPESEVDHVPRILYLDLV